MLYLIRSYMFGGKFIYKVGYTNDVENRMNQYFYASPGFELISVREGDETLERFLHYYLRFLGLQYKREGKLDEWFLGEEQVRQIFHISQESLERKIWKNRNKVFDHKKIRKINPTTLDNSVFHSLYEKNKYPSFGEEFLLCGDRVIKQNIPQVDIEFRNFLIKTGQLKAQESSFDKNLEKIVSDFLNNSFYTTGLFHERMKIYCKFVDQHKEFSQEIQDLICFKLQDDIFKEYYESLGTKGCSALRFQGESIRQKIRDNSMSSIIGSEVYNIFQLGESYTLKDIKQALSNVYRDLGVTKSPKATDIKEFFDVERVKFSDPVTKKRIEGLRIVSKKLIV